MGAAAASGGYYIASPGNYIYANPLSITGSIGIFYGKADVAELMRRIGVSVEVYKTAPRADAESIFRPFSPEERGELEHKVAQFYDVFLTRVASGRKMSKADVDAVGQGRVWTGQQALDRKLGPPQDTPLGGLIYIHGNGSSADWTWGCVALENHEIRELYDAVNIGTPVTINP